MDSIDAQLVNPIPSFRNQHLISRLNATIAKLAKDSSRASSIKAIRHQCIATCIFTLGFDEPVVLPSYCARQVSSYECIGEVYILYDRSYSVVEFFTDGTELDIGIDNVTEIVLQTVSLRFVPDQTGYSVIFFCLVGDICDWNYVRQVIEQFTLANYQPMYNSLKPLLYEESGTNVSQCYSQSNVIDCNGGMCISLVIEGTSEGDRSCSNPATPVIGIDIERDRVFAGPTIDAVDGFIYVCSRDLCNSPTVESSVQSIIQSNAAALSVITPTPTATTTPTSKTTSVGPYYTNYLVFVVFMLTLRA